MVGGWGGGGGGGEGSGAADGGEQEDRRTGVSVFCQRYNGY